MFGIWLLGISKEMKQLVLLGAATTCWSLWLCMNDIAFERKSNPSTLQVIFSVIHWVRSWIILQKPVLYDLVAVASQKLAHVAKDFFFAQAHEWRSNL